MGFLARVTSLTGKVFARQSLVNRREIADENQGIVRPQDHKPMGYVGNDGSHLNALLVRLFKPGSSEMSYVKRWKNKTF